MAYSANQYNYCTPLSSASSLDKETNGTESFKYFTLFDNVLDGSYIPIAGDVGLWGSSLSLPMDSSRFRLNEPFVITGTTTEIPKLLRLVSTPECFPVDFSIEFFNGTESLSTVNITDNRDYAITLDLEELTEIHQSATSYTFTISTINVPNQVARIRHLYIPSYKASTDNVTLIDVCYAATANIDSTLFRKTDALVLSTTSVSHITNYIKGHNDILTVTDSADSTLTNVHSRMKEPSRRIYGKVNITYTDAMLETTAPMTATSEAYNSVKEQLIDGVTNTDHTYFTLYDNDLTGRYVVSDSESQVGWTSGTLSNSEGVFEEAPSVTINFGGRPVLNLIIYFDDSHGSTVEDFMVEMTLSDGTVKLYAFVHNTDSQVLVTSDDIPDVESLTITIQKVSKPYTPATVLEVPIVSTLLYKGYEDVSDLISIDFLEELTYKDDVEALGGISANEVTVVLDNSNRNFDFNNKQSLVSKQLKRNRKIVPWLGVEIIPNEIEWYRLGTFWSYKWDVPVGTLRASVVGFDTIGLLGTTDFTNHQVLVNMSIGELIEYVLNDAKINLSFIEYKIDSALYDIIIPYAWFEASNHAAALRKISECYPMHIYCDREGRICAAPQKLKLDFYYDTWSDATNVIDKQYSSLHTTLPNIVNVSIKEPLLVSEGQIAKDNMLLYVDGVITKTLNFSKPYVADLKVLVDCDESVTYTYITYSWGVIFTFKGTGNVYSIECAGTVVDVSHSSTITQRDDRSAYLNGAVTRDIASDFIQTTDLANTIISRLFSLAENDRYDATVEYRGDIALSINDPILLQDGLAPDNRYNIRRHQLSWNGALVGSADLNT